MSMRAGLFMSMFNYMSYVSLVLSVSDAIKNV